ncbi:MAG: hypothetical protein IJR48_03280 [Oscillibacter sp.]|nr:hypothetical protein [Oscillibacter sp.]
MSEKERATALLELVPEYKMGYVIAYLEGLTADEADDDAYCQKLYEDYLKDPEHGDFVSFEDALKECGVSPDEL